MNRRLIERDTVALLFKASLDSPSDIRAQLRKLGFHEENLLDEHSFWQSLYELPNEGTTPTVHDLMTRMCEKIDLVQEQLAKLSKPMFVIDSNPDSKEVRAMWQKLLESGNTEAIETIEKVGNVSRTTRVLTKQASEEDKKLWEAIVASRPKQSAKNTDDGTLDGGEDFEHLDENPEDNGIPATAPGHPDYVPPDVAGPKPRRKMDKQERIGKLAGNIIKDRGLLYEKKYSTFGPTVYRTKFYNLHINNSRHSMPSLIRQVRIACELLRELSGVDKVEYKKKYNGCWTSVSIYVFYKKGEKAK